MLSHQIASAGKNKKSVEWGVDLKVVKLAHKTERDDDASRNDKLNVILQAIEDGVQLIVKKNTSRAAYL